MPKIKSVYAVALTTNEPSELETFSVTGAGQSAALAINKKFKGKLIRKILLGFEINEQFIPLRLKP